MSKPKHVMNCVECDLAAELTLPQWRTARVAAIPRRRLRIRSIVACVA